VCISVCLISLAPCTFTHWEKWFLHLTKILWESVTVILLALYHISYRLVTLLKVTDASIQVSDIFYLTVSSKYINFSSQIFFILFPKCLLASLLTWFRLSTLLWFGSCNHCTLTCYLWSKCHDHLSSNHGLCGFSSYRSRLLLAEVLIFSSMFSQALFMSLLSVKFSKATNLFGIVIWYCSLTSSSFTFLRLNLPHHTSVPFVYSLPIFP
jgi:hypothetical protein